MCERLGPNWFLTFTSVQALTRDQFRRGMNLLCELFEAAWGVPLVAFAVWECHADGTLHMHLVAYIRDGLFGGSAERYLPKGRLSPRRWLDLAPEGVRAKFEERWGHSRGHRVDYWLMLCAEAIFCGMARVERIGRHREAVAGYCVKYCAKGRSVADDWAFWLPEGFVVPRQEMIANAEAQRLYREYGINSERWSGRPKASRRCPR